jgi:hypothetical protein
MKVPFASWSRRERVLLVLSAVALGASLLAMAGGSDASKHRNLVVSKEIANNTIRSVDVGDGNLKASDLGAYFVYGDKLSVPGSGGARLAAVSCKPGDQVIAGGVSFEGADSKGLDVSKQIPIFNGSSRTWEWDVVGVNNSADTATLQSIASCING